VTEQLLATEKVLNDSCNAGLQLGEVTVFLCGKYVIGAVLNHFALVNNDDTIALLNC